MLIELNHVCQNIVSALALSVCCQLKKEEKRVASSYAICQTQDVNSQQAEWNPLPKGKTYPTYPNSVRKYTKKE